MGAVEHPGTGRPGGWPCWEFISPSSSSMSPRESMSIESIGMFGALFGPISGVDSEELISIFLDVSGFLG